MSGESLVVVPGESAAATNNGMINPSKASSSCTGNDDEQEKLFLKCKETCPLVV